MRHIIKGTNNLNLSLIFEGKKERYSIFIGDIEHLTGSFNEMSGLLSQIVVAIMDQHLPY